MKRRILLCMFLAVLASPAMSQIVMVSGYVLQHDADIVIPFANLMNRKTRAGTVSDINGFYTILVAPGDTVEVSAIGFEKMRLALPKEFTGTTLEVNLRMKKTVYDLKTVNVSLMNYERFKQEFEAMKLPETRKMVVGDPSVYRNYTAPKETFGYTFKGPFTALYNKFNRKARELEKLQELMENDNKQMVASMKLTIDLVKQVTGLTEDAEIDSFLRYCNMSNEFIANSTRYDIMVALDRCHRQYQKDRGTTTRDTIIGYPPDEEPR